MYSLDFILFTLSFSVCFVLSIRSAFRRDWEAFSFYAALALISYHIILTQLYWSNIAMNAVGMFAQ